MKDKKKIILFYTGIAVFAALIIFGFILLGNLREQQAKQKTTDYEGIVRNVKIQNVEETIGQFSLLKVEEDFTAVNQFGEEVTFQSLKDKVWVFAQFYGTCPECRSTNLGVLKELYEKYGEDENFQIVTISVQPDKDRVVLMKSLADFYCGEKNNWWFISAEAAEVNEFCQKHMGYMAFKKNPHYGKPNELEVLHDMGMSVFGKDMEMWTKVDISSALKVKDDLRVELARKKLELTIEWALGQIKSNKK